MKAYSSKQSSLLLSLASLLFVVSLVLTPLQRLSPDEKLQGNSLNIAVEIAGNISNPGIYSFAREVTVEQALLGAGGIGRGKIGNPQVLDDMLNDGSKIVVKRDKKRTLTIELARMEPEKCIVFSIPLNLNEVEEEHLTLIPGIGPRLAQRIIQYRSKKGGFRKIEELIEVRGIGEQKLRNLELYLIIPKG
jgi:competence protein ComEA